MARCSPSPSSSHRSLSRAFSPWSCSAIPSSCTGPTPSTTPRRTCQAAQLRPLALRCHVRLRCSSSADAACLLDFEASLRGRLAESSSRRPRWTTLGPRLSGRLRVLQPLRREVDDISFVYRILTTCEDDLVTIMHLDSFFKYESDYMLVSTRTLSSSADSSPRSCVPPRR